ncbi:DNA cytosine methyltransferase [Rhizobium laguerreae]|uniref:DNA cytosine methyltransferase n=1 Tax=Rhizobium laguerreae TaxID=1076926 RepID=UPI001C8FD66A|nr:DNA cytosine methyltransferase [Rhizobium laguerreae]MBY3441613.1 DNA cytosine methyltransferase [Rhizobium laguerreae]
MFEPIRIVDLFSGPGGLSEGFATCKNKDGQNAYEIGISVEKEKAAHRTLRLRSFLREFSDFPPEYYSWLKDGGDEPDWKDLYPYEWRRASEEALCAELGTSDATELLSSAIERIGGAANGRTVLIGGPPCQAYSLVGRARNSGKKDYVPAKDQRHFLYREYCRVLNEFSPAVFVMENVKGMLSSTVEGLAIFGQVRADLESSGRGYKLYALSGDENTELTPQHFLVQAEDFGIPQARHRVIIVGVRRDIASRLPHWFSPRLTKSDRIVTVADVLSNMPLLRSGLSRNDSPAAWREAMETAIQHVEGSIANYSGEDKRTFVATVNEVRARLASSSLEGRWSPVRTALPATIPPKLRSFLNDPRLSTLHGHETRAHMPSDLSRYLFAACYAIAEGSSPKSPKFPPAIAPQHVNWTSGKFDDRFRVQRWNHPSSTVTSHISKDGHYFIHADPCQCRSLTVREAARLQTFPDNYVFLGTRTEQYVQVGNAVPPFLALQIAEAILPIFDYV